MEYEKIYTNFYVSTVKEGGQEGSEGTASSLMEFEQHKNIHAIKTFYDDDHAPSGTFDNIIPFHSVDIARSIVESYTESKPDPYGCDEDSGNCQVVFDNSVQMNEAPEPLEAYVTGQVILPQSAIPSFIDGFPDYITLTIGDMESVISKQDPPFEGYPKVYYATEPSDGMPGNPSADTGYGSDTFVVTIYALKESVAAGTYRVILEFCNE